MAFKLDEKESFNDSLRRIVAEQIDKAISSLSTDSESVDKSVHDSRVCIKKIRALLRLVRHSLRKGLFELEDKAFRDVGRLLAQARNPAAMSEMIDLIDERVSDTDTEALLQTTRRLISESKELNEDKRSHAMLEAQARLGELRSRVDQWPEVVVDASFAKGLRRVFKLGRTTFAHAYEASTIDSFHEWRKHVKHLLYQSRVLRPIWPRYLKVLRGDLKTIADLLSEDHDLALLRKMISDMDLTETWEGKSMEALFELIDSRRREVEEEARLLGSRIYAEKPRAFAGRMHAYWKEWQHD